MNRTLVPTLIGVFSSLFAIWLLHNYLMVDDCLDQGGSFDYATAKCFLSSGQVLDPKIESFALVLYFVVGFGVSFIVSSIIKKLINIKK